MGKLGISGHLALAKSGGVWPRAAPIATGAVVLLGQRPWRDHGAGWGRVTAWLWAIAASLAVAVVWFALCWSLVAIRRRRLRPESVWTEGNWWLSINVPNGAERFVVRVVDDVGAVADKDWTENLDDRDRVVVWFPSRFDVGGMRAGRKQPWGTYRVEWQVKHGERTIARAEDRFTWSRPF